ncbi:hypothetical protein ACFYMX_25810 [Streptomyces griseofuscus]|nr:MULTISPECIES: hypothetical protein [Streptomyces]MYQ92702.1 hypothetical protein [Streptomyces sp. SID4946]MYR85570.1 hypothetical protein [Streptomyces sp. SID685]MBA9047116.1 hypothetical protein [Streptomyces murinus]MBJ7002434.1 hypothetical protein [Streptomyces sp. CRPSP2-6A1]MYR91505.1 hypothetical protein [Streptomyces sp. SID685]
MRTKSTMGKKMIRSGLVATFSAVVALGVLSGPFGAKSDLRADTKWPSVATLDAGSVVRADTKWPGDTKWPSVAAAGVTNAVPADTKWPTDTKWPSVAGS